MATEPWYQGKAASPLLYISQVACASYKIMQNKLFLVFFQMFFEGHFAISVPFTDDRGVGWQSQKYESTHLKELDEALWYEHPSRVSF